MSVIIILWMQFKFSISLPATFCDYKNHISIIYRTESVLGSCVVLFLNNVRAMKIAVHMFLCPPTCIR